MVLRIDYLWSVDAVLLMLFVSIEISITLDIYKLSEGKSMLLREKVIK